MQQHSSLLEETAECKEGWGVHPRLGVQWLARSMPCRTRARQQANSRHTSRLAGGLLHQNKGQGWVCA